LAQISGEIMMKPVPSEEEVVPLVLKKYKKGELTSRLLDDGFDGELILSKTLGAGMKYAELKEEGKVIIVCGGTGLLPFCDFIDLLFKRVLLLENNAMAEKCAAHDFVVREDLIKKRSFKLYCAAESETDLLPLALFQMEHLSKSTKIMFEAVFRLRSGEDRFKGKYPNLMTQKEYFNEKVTADLKYGSVCQIYICGSPEMNASMGQIMQENEVSSESYHFM
jgi:NAD(P)H-flavin reductase